MRHISRWIIPLISIGDSFYSLTREEGQINQPFLQDTYVQTVRGQTRNVFMTSAPLLQFHEPREFFAQHLQFYNQFWNCFRQSILQLGGLISLCLFFIFALSIFPWGKAWLPQHQSFHHLRLSPYVHSNLLKFRPDSLLQSIQFQNTLQIECVSPDLSQMINYRNYIDAQNANGSSLPCKCYLCTVEESQLNQCKECKRVICFNCSRLCLNCKLIYCRAEVKYNYELEGEICSNCQGRE